MGLLDSITEDQILGGLLGAGAASGAKGNFLARMAAGIGEGQKFGAWREQKARQRSQDEMQAEYKQLMMKKMQMDAEREQRAAAQEQTNTGALRSALSPMSGGDAMAGGGGPTPANAARIGQQQPFDVRQFIAKNPGVDLQGIEQYMKLDKAMNPAAKFETLAPGSSMFKMGPNGPELAMTAPDRPEKPVAPPTSVQEFLYGQQNPAFNAWDQSRKKAGASSVSVNTGQKGFDNTLKLRGDFRSEPIYKAHGEVQSAHSQISAALKQQSPAGDLAGATKLMKILDPGSVVRESELGMAMAASGLLDRVQNYADMVIKGTKLTPTQRKDFQSLSDALLTESGKQYTTKQSEYSAIADRNGLNAVDVIGEKTARPQAKPPADSPAKAMPSLPPAQEHKGRAVRDTTTGKTLRSNGMSWVEVK